MGMPLVKKIAARLDLRVLVFWGLIALTGLSISGGSPPVYVEILAYLVLLTALFSFRPLRALVRRLDPARRILFLCVLGLMFVGQIVSNHRISYPFPQWNMYCAPTPSNQYFDYLVTHRSGRTEHFPFDEIYPANEPRMLMGRFDRIARRIKHPAAPTARDRARLAKLEGELRTLLSVYNEHFPRDPVTEMRVFQKEIPIRQYHGPESIESSLLLELEED